MLQTFIGEIGLFLYKTTLFVYLIFPICRQYILLIKIKIKYMERLKLKRVVALLLFCSFLTHTYAQSSQETLAMSLEECIEYAKENSVTIQKAMLDIENSQYDEVIAKGSFLPSISGSVGQNLSSNPLSSDSDSKKLGYNGSYGVNLSMSLYSGGKNRAQLQQSSIGTEISNLELEEFENSLELSITEVYVEILYAMEQIKVAESSLEVGMKSEARAKEFYEAGSINEAELAQFESSTASYKYDLIVAETQLSSLHVSLKHLLDISQEITISVKEPDLSDTSILSTIPTISDVYYAALESRPEIQYTNLMIESAQLDETVARADLLPSLSLTAGTGLSHSSYSNFTFSEQMRENFSTSIGLSLSIPIFNGYKSKSAISKSQNYVKSANITLTQAQKELYQTIETLHNNAQTSQAKYYVSELQLKALEKSLRLTTEQFELKMKTALELLTEQDSYNQSSQDFLINKYQLILNKALLNYYKTDVIKL